MKPKTQENGKKKWIVAVALVALSGLVAGIVIALSTLDNRGGYSQQSSTEELLAAVQRKDNSLRRFHRRVVQWVPDTWQAFMPFFRAPDPDSLKLIPLGLLQQRTNESVKIVPELVAQLNLLRPDDFLAGNLVRALAAHGAAAGDAVRWLEAAAQGPTNLFGLVTYSDLGSRVTISEVYQALAAIKGNADETYSEITNRISSKYLPEQMVSASMLESGPYFSEEVNELIGLAAGFKVSKLRRVEMLKQLLESPSPYVQKVAWTHLIDLAPETPELLPLAINYLSSRNSRDSLSLQSYLALAVPQPEILKFIESDVQTKLAGSDPYEYWSLAKQLGILGINSSRFAQAFADAFFANRISRYFGEGVPALSADYHFLPEFGDYLRNSGANLEPLLAKLQAAAMDEKNSHRFDDAQVYARLSGDGHFEHELLLQKLPEASAAQRKVGLSRLAELLEEPGQIAPTLSSFLRDSDPQVRRRALMEFAGLGGAAIPFLVEINQMKTNDPSMIVRWQAQRTAEALQGLETHE